MATVKRNAEQKSKLKKDRSQHTAAKVRTNSLEQPAVAAVSPISVETLKQTRSNDPAPVNIQQIIQTVNNHLLTLSQGQINPEIRTVGTSLTLAWHVEMRIGSTEQAESDPADPVGDTPKTALELTSELLQHPGAWLRTPNENLGNRRPIDLLDTDEEEKVSNLLNAVKYGLFS